jgi:hypothetical protein
VFPKAAAQINYNPQKLSKNLKIFDGHNVIDFDCNFDCGSRFFEPGAYRGTFLGCWLAGWLAGWAGLGWAGLGWAGLG